MVWSSSMLYSLWMKAVWITLGCCAAAAAPTAGAVLPLGEVLPVSPFSDWACGCECAWCEPLRSAPAPLSEGGPMEVEGEGVMSIGSRGGGGASVELDEGRMGIDLCKFAPWGSAWKGLRRASATEAMAASGALWRAAAVLRC